jgi:hypothetical protein
LSTHLCLDLPSGLFLSDIPTNILYAFYLTCGEKSLRLNNYARFYLFHIHKKLQDFIKI